MSLWKRPYSAYLFDLDGTLVDTALDINEALNRTLEDNGFPTVDVALTRHWVGHGAKILIEQALQHSAGRIDEAQSAAMLAHFLSYYSTHLAVLSEPYPEVVSTLQDLKAAGAKLAVVTNKMSALTEPLLNEIGLAVWFDEIVSGDSAPRPKPAADPVELTLARLGIAAGDALFVGDSETDVLAARAAGVAVVCVRDGYNHGQDVTQLGADGVIATFGELL